MSTGTTTQMRKGFKRACAFGRTAVVEFLPDRGLDVGASLADGVRQTTGSHLRGVRRACGHREGTLGTTPLTWALHA